MARKLPGLRRNLDARSLFSVAYGEVASSIYFALGVIALHAQGFTPVILLISGALFLIVALSYAEGTSALPETGGAATFVRRALNDLAGFMTGWALFLDYLIVIALSALFAPHYLAAALGVPEIGERPWDIVAAVAVIVVVAAVRLVRRPSLYALGIVLPALDLLVQLVLVVLGAVLVFSTHTLTHGISLGQSPSWHQLLFAVPLAMLAYTGLETVANLAEEARRPGVDLPRSSRSTSRSRLSRSRRFRHRGRSSGAPGFTRRLSGLRRRSEAICRTRLPRRSKCSWVSAAR